ncbi:MAG: TIGR04086 family membrane protein [Lachnospiraceae bacterium]|nr:TIGR04086 family membrane protein [Lachnospiraceae bacterium]
MRSSFLFRLTRAVVCSYLVSAVLVFLLSWGLYVMKWEAAGSKAAVHAVYFLACLAGGFLAGRQFVEKRLLWGLFTGLLYALVLITVSQLTGGPGSHQLPEIAVMTGICLAGGAFGSILS